MDTLVVGFDSAWTQTTQGAIVRAVLNEHGAICELGLPQRVRYSEAAEVDLPRGAFDSTIYGFELLVDVTA